MKKEKKKKNPSLMKDLKIKRKEDKVLSSGPRPARTHPLTRSVKKMPLFWRRRLLFARAAEKKRPMKSWIGEVTKSERALCLSR